MTSDDTWTSDANCIQGESSRGGAMTSDEKAMMASRLIEDTLNNRIREMEEAVDRVMGTPRSKGDWERGYAKGYARALDQMVELCEFHLPTHVEMIQAIALKLRKDVGQDV